jgi:hypothetical protein
MITTVINAIGTKPEYTNIYNPKIKPYEKLEKANVRA